MSPSDGLLETREALSKVRELAEEELQRAQLVEVRAPFQTWQALSTFRKL